MKWLALKLLLIVAIGVVFLCLPIYSTTSKRGIQTKNLSNAKQLGTGVKLYAMDHGGRFPVNLTELEPDYIPHLEELLYHPNDGKSVATTYPVRCDWLYFGAFHDEKNPPTILIASPQAFTEDRKSKRIVIYGDGSGKIANDEDFQPKLGQTIKELNERAKALTQKSGTGL